MAIVTALLGDIGGPTRVGPGELRTYFEDWETVHYREEGVAELVAVLI
jgi:hypothetical protein